MEWSGVSGVEWSGVEEGGGRKEEGGEEGGGGGGLITRTPYLGYGE